MNTFEESELSFTFPKEWVVKKYDEHRFYHYLSGRGFKGIDLIALTPDKKLVLIEVKNYNNRFPQNGVDPTDELLNNTLSYSNQFVQKFEDTFQLIKIVQQFYQRKFWYRLFSKPLQQFFSYSFLLKYDWGFWTMATKSLESNNVQLILWLEISNKIRPTQRDKINTSILNTFQKALPDYIFKIYSLQNNVSQISASQSKH